jgi:hypothetical protein
VSVACSGEVVSGVVTSREVDVAVVGGAATNGEMEGSVASVDVPATSTVSVGSLGKRRYRSSASSCCCSVCTGNQWYALSAALSAASRACCSKPGC